METKAENIIAALCDRSGFDNWWFDLDEEIQEEIKAEIQAIADSSTEKTH